MQSLERKTKKKGILEPYAKAPWMKKLKKSIAKNTKKSLSAFEVYGFTVMVDTKLDDDAPIDPNVIVLTGNPDNYTGYNTLTILTNTFKITHHRGTFHIDLPAISATAFYHSTLNGAASIVEPEDVPNIGDRHFPQINSTEIIPTLLRARNGDVIEMPGMSSTPIYREVRYGFV